MKDKKSLGQKPKFEYAEVKIDRNGNISDYFADYRRFIVFTEDYAQSGDKSRSAIYKPPTENFDRSAIQIMEKGKDTIWHKFNYYYHGLDKIRYFDKKKRLDPANKHLRWILRQTVTNTALEYTGKITDDNIKEKDEVYKVVKANKEELKFLDERNLLDISLVSSNSWPR